MGAERNTCWILVEKPRGRRLLGTPSHNIKMDLGEIGWGDTD
jgi:hypothetical protein